MASPINLCFFFVIKRGVKTLSSKFETNEPPFLIEVSKHQQDHKNVNHPQPSFSESNLQSTKDHTGPVSHHWPPPERILSSEAPTQTLHESTDSSYHSHSTQLWWCNSNSHRPFTSIPECRSYRETEGLYHSTRLRPYRNVHFPGASRSTWTSAHHIP